MARFSLFTSMLLATVMVALAANGQMLEQNVERTGATYQRISVGHAGASACWSRCAADPQCKAWTWQRPGIAGTQGMCLLKTAITTATYSPCCVSGISNRLERQIELALQIPASSSSPIQTGANITLNNSPIPIGTRTARRVIKITPNSTPNYHPATITVNKITLPVTNKTASDIHLAGE